MVGSSAPSAPIFENAFAEASLMLEVAARALVYLPERVRVGQMIDGDTGKLILWVDATDINRVIGPAGRTQQSLGTVLQAMAKKSGVRLSLQIEVRNP
jgi:predicted RNA-binding protein YlqC (UPF0109 family)